ncbi:MAG: hypothetical protein L0H93_23055 [Nocardioides sp.]|nr:hypothetical protein [Nocardioides sp.]
MIQKFDASQPFTRADAMAAGVDPRVLRTSSYRRVLRGVWIASEAWTPYTPIFSALKLHPRGAVATHFSAARLLDLPVPDSPFIHVTVFDPLDRRFRAEVKSHVTTRKISVTHRHGLPCTSPLKTFVDLAGHTSLVDMVVLGDAMIKKYVISVDDLVEYCANSTDYYAGLARLAASYVRKGVDSPMESRLRMLLVLAGLPEPTVDFRLYDEFGNVRRRIDLSYPHLRLAIEYDGRHHIRFGQWKGDIERREDLGDEDWVILTVIAEGVFKVPEETIERVRRKILRLGGGPLPSINPAWLSHFAA